MNRIEGDLQKKGRLQTIPVDVARAERLLDDARKHLSTAATAIDSGDLAGAYQLGYDAATKALTALLALDGLRLKGEGAHANLITLIQEKYAAVDGVLAVAKLDRLRRTRNEAEYRGYWFDRDEVIADLLVASQVISFVEAAWPSAEPSS